MALVWLARPQARSEPTRQALQARGHEVLVSPLLVHRKRDTPLPAGAPFAGALLTSAYGAAALARVPQERLARSAPVFTTGDATAGAARAAGFTDCRAGGGDAQALAALVNGQGGGGPYLWPRAQAVAQDLVPLVHATVVPWCVYAMDRPARLEPAVADALASGRIAAVLLTSPAIARNFAAMVPPSRAAPIPVCLSAAVRNALVTDDDADGDGAAMRELATRAHVAPSPRMDSLLATLDQALG